MIREENWSGKLIREKNWSGKLIREKNWSGKLIREKNWSDKFFNIYSTRLVCYKKSGRLRFNRQYHFQVVFYRVGEIFEIIK